MMEDKFLFMSDAQAITETADSTNVLDLGDDGDARVKQAWWVVRLNTGFSSTSNTLAIALHTATSDSFAALQGMSLAATATSALTSAGSVVIKRPLPLGVKRYLKTVYTCSTTLATGKVDSFITFEPDNY